MGRRVFRRFADDAPGGNAGAMVMGFAATMEILTSREFKIAGAVGPCCSLKKKFSTRQRLLSSTTVLFIEFFFAELGSCSFERGTPVSGCEKGGVSFGRSRMSPWSES